MVGIDGLESAHGALRYAVEEARRRGARLRVVSAWHVPGVAFIGGGFAAPFDQETFDALRANAQEIVDAAVAEAHRLAPSLACEGEAVEAQAAAALLAEAAGQTWSWLGTAAAAGSRACCWGR